ncbi:MAG: cytochrome P450 [Gammaproteobacteria bacterium]|nr:cytochrome P450 [Gammaproteobacteria bacterium]
MSIENESPLTTYDPLDAAIRRNPYPWYQHLRRHEPVKFLPGMNAYAVARHEDVRQLMLNHGGFSSDPLIQLAFSDFNPAPGARYMIASDPPDHTRLRTLVNKAFSKRALTEMEDAIRATINQLIERLEGKTHFDFIEEFSSPLPVSVVGDILGVETSKHADFRRWSNNVTAGGSAAVLGEAQQAAMHQDAADFRQYFLDRIADARAHPQDNLICALVDAEEQGQKLSADEVLALCVLLLIGGNETTTNMLANALVTLRDYPEVEREIRGNRALIPDFIEESLRHTSPIQLLFRRATAATRIAGVDIPENAIVMPTFASANRDESVFSKPDTLDIRRPDLRKHVAFGWGIHMCVGRALAAIEGEIALNALFDRYASIQLASADFDLCDAFYLRGPKGLPVEVRPN